MRWGATAPYWPEARFHSWRIITPETEWRGLEPQKGKWHFENLDSAVARARARGIQIMLTLGQTPPWAAARPMEKVPNGWGASSEPKSMADWENYIRTVVTRYKGKIKYYELWNEPRLREVDPYRATAGFTGTAKQMLEMGTIVKRVLNEIDPDAKLVSPAFDARMIGLKRLKAWLDAGGGNVSDVIAYHIYATTPEEIPEVVGAIRGILEKYGLGHLELWNTESGFLIETPDRAVKPKGGAVFAQVHTQIRGAAYMARSLILGAASGLDRFYWYAWDIPDMAMSTGKGQYISLVGHAYVVVQRWLRGATIRECRTADDRLWVCTLNRGARRAWLVWNTTGSREWAVPANGQARRYETLSGDEGRVGMRGRVHVNEAPLLVLSDDEKWGTL
ncbi:MAG: endo-1,4-beta-xylanase [Thiobacillus sp.]|nr:endo-1,4-beta-xylanase [Thiobacillus sp.]